MKLHWVRFNIRPNAKSNKNDGFSACFMDSKDSKIIELSKNGKNDLLISIDVFHFKYRTLGNYRFWI